MEAHMAMLQKGMAGEPVKRMQAKLGVTADGDFGPGTDTALRAYQKSNGLAVDGIAGPDTFVHMGLYELVLLLNGSTGDTVKKVQAAVGVAADGVYGPATAKAVHAFQSKNGIIADGVVGPDTLAKMGIFKEITADVIEKAIALDDAGDAPPPVTNADFGTAPAPERRSVWARVKGLFS
jgi:peptidoglycan hydrolase-like protein with peptidoglycan-binding domain